MHTHVRVKHVRAPRCTQTQEEASDNPRYASVDDKIHRIPEDIRPKMASYRLEMIFWGVRDMRKIKYMAVRRPKVIVECSGVYIQSEVMSNVRKFSNFQKPHVMIELVITIIYLISEHLNSLRLR